MRVTTDKRKGQALEIAVAVQMENAADIQARLGLYGKRQPWRESFRARNRPPELDAAQ